ncbi:glycoside hydrolase superfamily [Endogone sp. FLAS-F59071]|nr:glycoside hydrolase superfamily [Endogone sp. FLAS-F59071]|eukprot:RUS17406.1 glycoside hydrolase superfamily [Endogone sp. FLAS-F59071]
MKLSFITAAIAILTVVPANAEVFLWPKPQSVEWGNGQLQIPKNFKIHGPDIPELQSAIERYTRLIWHEKWTPAQVAYTTPPVDATSVRAKPLASIAITVKDPHADLALGVDESYRLVIPGGGGAGSIDAQTVWGALRALETFSQLVQGHVHHDELFVARAPVTIEDAPVYTHRGLMLDTSRNYYPVNDILRTIDAMAYNKLNVFHWHITDSHSFPLLLDTVPELADKGAYVLHGRKMVYTTYDVRRIVKHARDRGVRVVPEIDMPAHTGSWAGAYKEITTCTEKYFQDPNGNWDQRYASEPGSGQLNPVLSKTYEIVKKVIDEVASLFPDSTYHAGGDEPVFRCWNDSASVVEFQNKHNINGNGLLGMFLDHSLGYVKQNKKTPVIWEDAVTSSNLPISKDTILQVWVNPAQQAIEAGYKIIASNYNFWYLDCGHGGWGGNDTSYDEQVEPPVPAEIQKLLNSNDDWANNWNPYNWGGPGGDWCCVYRLF